MSKEKGFTLVELLMTVAIIGILATIAVPMYTGTIKRSARSEAYSNLQTLRLLEEQYFAEHGCYYMEGDPLVCTNKTGGAAIPYKGTYGVDDGGIEDFLSGFKPGEDAKLACTYKIEISAVGTANAAAFTASAVPKNTGRLKGDPTYTIDQNNARTNW